MEDNGCSMLFECENWALNRTNGQKIGIAEVKFLMTVAGNTLK
jgi:hypothetical protein